MTEASPGEATGPPRVSTLQLVPTPRHLAHLAPLAHLARSADRARTYRDYVSRAAAELAPDLAAASGYTTQLLAAAALRRLPPGRLRVPAEPAAAVALAAAVDRAIARLRRAGTTPEDLAAVGSKSALVLADLLADVDARLAEAGLHDPRGAAGLAARRLVDATRARGGPRHGREAAVAITGLAAWEPNDCGLLEALHATLRRAGGAGVTVELPRLSGPLGGSFDDPIVPVAEELERRWASLDDPPEIAWHEATVGAPALVIAARDLEGEARAVATRVAIALADGIAPERIAVVVPDLEETRLTPLRAILDDAGVPFAEPRGRPVSSCPEGRIALALLTMAAGPVTRDQTIELLRAPGLHPGPWMERVTAREATRRAVTLAHRLRDVPVEVDRTGRLLVDALTDATRHRSDETWMPRALERMLKEVRWTGAPAGETPTPRHEVARRLGALIDRVSLGRPAMGEIAAALEGVSAEGSASPGGSTRLAMLALRAAGDSAAAVRAVREALRALVLGARAAGLESEPVSPSQLAAELALAVSKLGIGLGTAGSGAVAIGRPAELAGLTHDLVIVTGLDGAGYSGAEGGDGLLDERTRRMLPAASRPPSARQRQAWRRAELAWVMAGATQTLLTYTAGDTGDAVGSARTAPHDLVRWGRSLGAPAAEEPASRVSPRAARPDARAHQLVALAEGATPSLEISARAAAERARTTFFLYPRTAATGHTGRVVVVDRGRLVASVGGDDPARPIAVTAIERTAGCAFAGFARRVLRVRRAEDLGESADARDRGMLVHRALQAAFDGARNAGGAAEAVARARAAASRALGAGGALAPLRREAVEAAVDEAVAVVERAWEPGETFRFLVSEQRFGPPHGVAAESGSPWPSLAVRGPTPGEPVVYVDGQIDRVDLSADGRVARVVDYKSGRLPPAADHGRRVFQLPLYAAVVAEALRCEDVEAVYVAVRPRGLIQESPRGRDERRALGAQRDTVAQAARRVVLAMWDGDAAPRPAAATLCTRCEARDVCRRPAVAPVEEIEERS